MTHLTHSLFDKRFLIVAGKGGVGKSTVCAILGLLAARRGLKTCIAELNTREKASILFGKPPSRYHYQELRPSLYSINIQPEPALKEYGLMKLKFERLYRLVFENEAMKHLLKTIPGMNELFLLGKTFNMEREKDENGKPLWDLIIVDAPATGHGVSLLRLPDTILKLAKTGPMAEEVSDMKALLTDPKKTAIQLVTLPEEMPVRETFDLMKELENYLQIPPGYLFVNALWPALLKDEDHQALVDAKSLSDGDDPKLQAAFSCYQAMRERHQFQQKYLDELKAKMPWPKIELPYLFGKEFNTQSIETLADLLEEQLLLSPQAPGP